MIRPMIASPIFAAVLLCAGQTFAQGAFPAPLPGQPVAPTSKASPFDHRTAPPWQAGPPLAGAPLNECMKGFYPLREEAEKRGKLIKAAGDRKAGPEEACKLIGEFRQSEIKMIKYIEANLAKCGLPPQINEQFKAGQKRTAAMYRKVCAVARRPQWRGPPPVGPGDFEVRPLPVDVIG